MPVTTTALKIGGYQPERSVHTRSIRALSGDLSQRLGDRIDIAFEPNIGATGRPVSDLLSLTDAGALDMCYFSSSYVTKRVPELGLLDLAFEGGTRERVWSKLDGAFGQRLKAAVAARTGYEVLGFWDNGIRHVSNGVRPIRHPRDCQGLSVRTLDNAHHQEVFAGFGFKPRFIDVKDLAAAVTSRQIDAQENPLTNVINFEIQKTHRHVSLLGIFFGVALLLANREARNRWPSDVRSAIDEAALSATALQRRLAAEEDAACLAQLAAEGVAVVPPEDIDLSAFQAACAGVTAKEVASFDAELLALWRG